MKFLRIVAIAIFFHIVMNMFMPWWNIFIAGLIAGYFSRTTALKTMATVFLALSFYWIILILKIDSGNDHILSSRLAELMSISNSNVFIMINGIIGGLCGAVGSQVGFYMRKIVKKIKSEEGAEEMNTDDYMKTQPEWRDADLM